MWIFTNRAMLSVVVDRDNPHRLLVRARLRGDIEAVFPKAKVIVTERADYRFRASIDRAEVAARMVELVVAIDYDNFKGSLPDDQPLRRVFCNRTWHAGVAVQDAELDLELLGQRDQGHPTMSPEFVGAVASAASKPRQARRAKPLPARPSRRLIPKS